MFLFLKKKQEEERCSTCRPGGIFCWGKKYAGYEANCLQVADSIFLNNLNVSMDVRIMELRRSIYSNAVGRTWMRRGKNALHGGVNSLNNL
jgi:hypothetical protein